MKDEHNKSTRNELKRFSGKEVSCLHHQLKTTTNLGNPLKGTHRMHPILGSCQLRVVTETTLPSYAFNGS